MRPALGRGNISSLCQACHIGGRVVSLSKFLVQALATRRPDSVRHQHLYHLSPILTFTLKDISLSISLCIQIAFTLRNNKIEDQVILQTDSNMLVRVRAAQKQMPSEKDPGSLFQAALMIKHTMSCMESRSTI